MRRTKERPPRKGHREWMETQLLGLAHPHATTKAWSDHHYFVGLKRQMITEDVDVGYPVLRRP